MRRILIGVCLLAVADHAPAQRAADFKESSTEEAAKNVVLGWDRLRSEGKEVEAIETYVSPTFKEHIALARQSTNGKSDYINMLERAKQMAAMPTRPKRPPPPGITIIPSQARASEDMVTLYHSYGADIFRVVGGKMTDHWDATPWEPYSTVGEAALLKAVAPPTASSPEDMPLQQ